MTSRAFVSGTTPKAFARNEVRKAHVRGYKTGLLTGWQLNAKQRREELEQLVRLRVRQGSPLGRPEGWATVIANLLRCLNGSATDHAVHGEIRSLRLPRIDPAIVAAAVAAEYERGGRRRILSPADAGALLDLLASERDEAEILKIDAIDEPRQDRRRRLDRESKQARRAEAAAMKPPTKSAMALALGVSRPTLDKWIEQGRVDPVTGEVRDFTKFVRRSPSIRGPADAKCKVEGRRASAPPIPGKLHETVSEGKRHASS